ncbi:MAG: DUF5615 family PIN-like protein [Acidobacteriota bacterium]
MLRFAADENFDNDIVRGVRRRNPEIDIVRVQDTDLLGADDPTLLEWAAREGRVFLTHDAATFTAHAYDRVRNGLLMPGVIQIKSGSLPGQPIEDILLLAECSLETDLEGKVLYLPLR